MRDGLQKRPMTYFLRYLNGLSSVYGLGCDSVRVGKHVRLRAAPGRVRTQKTSRQSGRDGPGDPGPKNAGLGGSPGNAHEGLSKVADH